MSEPVCLLCGKRRDRHLARTLNCPAGMKTRAGYVRFSETDTFTLDAARSDVDCRPANRYGVWFFLNGRTIDAETVTEYVNTHSAILASSWARDRAKELQPQSRTPVTWKVLPPVPLNGGD